MVRVWDPFVRIFHWSLVVAVAVAWLTGDEWDDPHVIAGYVVAGLVALRLGWGLVGGRYARFAQFLHGPSALLAYLRDTVAGRERRYLGHNPLGALMIVALLITLAGSCISGWLVENRARLAALPSLPQMAAPARADDDGKDEKPGEGREEVVEEVHEVLANGLLVLIGLHVVGVILSSVRHDENLARAMVTGDKRAPGPGDIA